MNHCIFERVRLMKKDVSADGRPIWHLKTVLLREDRTPDTVSVTAVVARNIEDMDIGSEFSCSGQFFHYVKNNQNVLYMMLTSKGEAGELGKNMVLMRMWYCGTKITNKNTSRTELLAEYHTDSGNSNHLIVDVRSSESVDIKECNENILVSGCLMERVSDDRTILKILAGMVSIEKQLSFRMPDKMSKVEEKGQVLYVKDHKLDISNITFPDMEEV